jgi:hypothetical protein
MVGYIFGFLSGFIIILAISANHDASMKNECEKNLPRSQKCILIAVPENKG